MPQRSGPARYKAAQQRGSNSTMWWMIGVVVLAVLILVVVRLTQHGSGLAKQDGQPVAASVLSDLTTVPLSLFNSVGIGPSGPNAVSVPVGGSSTLWKDSSGKPVFMYVGAEYCPYCAATRWALITALSRFGTFSGLEYMTSSSTDVYPNTPTFTFLHSSYTSSYVDFQPVEEQGPVAGEPLQSLNATQSAYRKKYENAPYFPSDASAPNTFYYPFLDVANRYLWQGAVYVPSLLANQTWPTIAAAVHSGQGTLGQSVVGEANYISAAICAVDGGQPSSVCGSAGVQAAAAKLPAARG